MIVWPIGLEHKVLPRVFMEIRQVRDDEFLKWRIAVRASQGFHTTPDDTVFMRAHRVEIDRLLACVDGDRIVGCGGVDSFDMTLPGGAQVPIAGVGYVGTSPSHRRRGIYRKIMNRIHNDARERGDLATTLWASQSNLYGRYGYGSSMPAYNWQIDMRHTAYAHFPSWTGHFLEPQRDEAIPLMTEAYDRARVIRPGMITRTPKRWEYEIHPVHTKDEYFVVYVEGEDSLAYARYTIEKNPEDEFRGTVHVVEAVAATDAAHAALWRYLLDLELVDDLKAHVRPVDDPLIWMLAEPRRLRRTLTDAIWMKFLDLRAMLEQRTYPVEDSLTLQIIDAETNEPSNLAVEFGTEGATCRPTSDPPDLVMNEAELAAMYAGAVECSMLASLGLVEVSARSSDAALRADAIFRTNPAGWNPYHF